MNDGHRTTPSGSLCASREARKPRRSYTAAEKAAALHLVREVGVGEAAKRLGISKYTLTEWKINTKALAYAPSVGTEIPLASRNRERLLAQLVHEQQIELSHPERSGFRHAPGGPVLKSPLEDEALDESISRAGVRHAHLLEWLDPTFDEVAERLAS